MDRIEIFFLYLLTTLFSLVALPLLVLPPAFISYFICPVQPITGPLIYGFLFRLPLFLAYLTLLPTWYSYGKGNRRRQRVSLLVAAFIAFPLALFFTLILMRGAGGA